MYLLYSQRLQGQGQHPPDLGQGHKKIYLNHILNETAVESLFCAVIMPLKSRNADEDVERRRPAASCNQRINHTLNCLTMGFLILWLDVIIYWFYQPIERGVKFEWAAPVIHVCVCVCVCVCAKPFWLD
jgi:hypothetical protein